MSAVYDFAQKKAVDKSALRGCYVKKQAAPRAKPFGERNWLSQEPYSGTDVKTPIIIGSYLYRDIGATRKFANTHDWITYSNINCIDDPQRKQDKYFILGGEFTSATEQLETVKKKSLEKVSAGAGSVLGFIVFGIAAGFIWNRQVIAPDFALAGLVLSITFVSMIKFLRK